MPMTAFIVLCLKSVGKTQMNEQSSRSHFVLTLRISAVNEATEKHGVLNLIYLAGSEQLSKSGGSMTRQQGMFKIFRGKAYKKLELEERLMKSLNDMNKPLLGKHDETTKEC
ncbi:Kinesin-like protein KIN-14N [Bienertia sinuspersici]